MRLPGPAGASFERRCIQLNRASTTESLASLGFTTGPGTLGIVPTGPADYPESVPPDNFNNFSFGNNWLNLFQVDNNYMLSDVFSKAMGKHSLSFGGSIATIN